MNIGQIIKDRYKILELLGEGGMAFVYKAEDRQLKEQLQLKLLNQTMFNRRHLLKGLREKLKRLLI